LRLPEVVERGILLEKKRERERERSEKLGMAEAIWSNERSDGSNVDRRGCRATPCESCSFMYVLVRIRK
jgi:hypothetical protein